MSNCGTFAADMETHFCGRIGAGFPVNSASVCSIYCKQVSLLSNTPSGCTFKKPLAPAEQGNCSHYSLLSDYETQILWPLLDARLRWDHDLCREDMRSLCDWGGEIPTEYEDWLKYEWPVGASCAQAWCGDGVIQEEEECDDYNQDSGDGCGSTCQEELGYECGNWTLPDWNYSAPSIRRAFSRTGGGRGGEGAAAVRHHDTSYWCKLKEAPESGEAFVHGRLELEGGPKLTEFGMPQTRLSFRTGLAAALGHPLGKTLIEGFCDTEAACMAGGCCDAAGRRHHEGAGALQVLVRLLEAAGGAGELGAELEEVQESGALAAALRGEGLNVSAVRLVEAPTLTYAEGYTEAMECEAGRSMPVDAKCGVELSLQFCVEPDDGLGDGPDDAEPIVVPLFSLGAGVEGYEVPTESVGGSESEGDEEGDFEAEEGLVGVKDGVVWIGARLNSCELYKEDVEVGLCGRLGGYKASAAVCEGFYCKHVAFLEAVGGGLCQLVPQAGAAAAGGDQCAGWSEGGYEEAVYKATDLRSAGEGGGLCREEVLGLCEWGDGGPPAGFAGWVEEHWGACGCRGCVPVEDAEEAATVVTAAVAATVGVAVAGAVATSVSTAVASSVAGSVAAGAGASVGGAGGAAVAAGGYGGVAGAAGGAGGAGGMGAGLGPTDAGCQIMISQVQFLAIAGRVGGPDAQPESARALSSGLGWSNMHLYQLWGEDPWRTVPFGRRFGWGWHSGECAAVRASDTELLSTLAAGGVLLGATFVLRTLVRAWLKMRLRREGKALPESFAPFPSWEMYIVVVLFQGLAESAGDAIASNCLAYIVAGGAVLLLLGAVLVWLLVMCWMALSEKKTYWTHISLKDGYARMQKQWAEAGEQPRFGARLRLRYNALHAWLVRGEWNRGVEEDGQSKHESTFASRWGGVFNMYVQGVWWWGLFGMAKAITIGVILGNVVSPAAGAIVVLALNGFELLVQTFLQPDGYWLDFARNLLRTLANVALLGSLLLLVLEILPPVDYSAIFQWLGIGSLAPLVLSSLAGACGQISWAVGTCCGLGECCSVAAQVAPDVEDQPLDEVRRFSADGLGDMAVDGALEVAQNQALDWDNAGQVAGVAAGGAAVGVAEEKMRRGKGGRSRDGRREEKLKELVATRTPERTLSSGRREAWGGQDASSASAGGGPRGILRGSGRQGVELHVSAPLFDNTQDPYLPAPAPPPSLAQPSAYDPPRFSDPRAPPNYGQPLPPPGYEQPLPPPGYGMDGFSSYGQPLPSSYGQPPLAPGYGHPLQPEPSSYGQPLQPPSYGQPLQPPGYDQPLQPPGYGGPPLQPPGYGVEGFPSYGQPLPPASYGQPLQPPAYGQALPPGAADPAGPQYLVSEELDAAPHEIHPLPSQWMTTPADGDAGQEDAHRGGEMSMFWTAADDGELQRRLASARMQGSGSLRGAPAPVVLR